MRQSGPGLHLTATPLLKLRRFTEFAAFQLRNLTKLAAPKASAETKN
jgi:hypothetical protein